MVNPWGGETVIAALRMRGAGGGGMSQGRHTVWVILCWMQPHVMLLLLRVTNITIMSANES